VTRIIDFCYYRARRGSIARVMPMTKPSPLSPEQLLSLEQLFALAALRLKAMSPSEVMAKWQAMPDGEKTDMVGAAGALSVVVLFQIVAEQSQQITKLQTEVRELRGAINATRDIELLQVIADGQARLASMIETLNEATTTVAAASSASSPAPGEPHRYPLLVTKDGRRVNPPPQARGLLVMRASGPQGGRPALLRLKNRKLWQLPLTATAEEIEAGPPGRGPLAPGPYQVIVVDGRGAALPGFTFDREAPSLRAVS